MIFLQVLGQSLLSLVDSAVDVGDFERLEICLLKWRLLKIKAIRIR